MPKPKLSDQQREILGCVYTMQQYFEQDINPKFLVRKLYTLTKRGRENPTPSETTSFYRSLAKLWKRNLIKVYNSKRGEKILKRTGTSLTKEGIVLGKQFATEKKERNLEKLLKSRFMRQFKRRKNLALTEE